MSRAQPQPPVAAASPLAGLNVIDVYDAASGWVVAECGRVIDRFADEEAAFKAALAMCDRRFDEGVASSVCFNRALASAWSA